MSSEAICELVPVGRNAKTGAIQYEIRATDRKVKIPKSTQGQIKAERRTKPTKLSRDKRVWNIFANGSNKPAERGCSRARLDEIMASGFKGDAISSDGKFQIPIG